MYLLYHFLTIRKIQELKKFHNIDDLEEFMLKHGENIVDMMGGEIDRIELKLRVSILFVFFYTHSILNLLFFS